MTPNQRTFLWVLFTAALIAVAVWLLVTALSTHAYAACHRFTVWKFPYPQRCGLATAPPAVKTDNHSWYVEITAPPLPQETRTPEQVKESLEHDQAVAAHKDELIRLLKERARDEVPH